MQRVLAKFGIAEIVRTGKISLKRGDQLLEMGGWGDGVERRSKLEKLQRHLQEQQAQQAAAAEQQSHATQEPGMHSAPGWCTLSQNLLQAGIWCGQAMSLQACRSVPMDDSMIQGQHPKTCCGTT